MKISNCLSALCQRVCVPHKGIAVLLIWSTLLHVSGVYFQLQLTKLLYQLYDDDSSDIDDTDSKNFISMTCVTIATFLFYPIAGLIAETVLKRYKLMIIGTILSTIGVLVLVLEAIGCDQSDCSIENYDKPKYHAFFIVSFIFYQIGLSLFEANAIQFGVDQLQFASNEQVSKFIPWYFWTTRSFPSYSLVFLALTILLAIFEVSHDYELIKLLKYIYFSTMYIVAFLSVLMSLVVAIGRKCNFITEPVAHFNPLKLIGKVLNYMRLHNQSVRRSAFTYGELLPSRIDLAKDRYGGPFTTEEVEDVKAFWRIVALLLTLIGLPLGNIYGLLSPVALQEIYKNTYLNHSYSNLSYLQYITFLLLYQVPYHSAIIIGVPIYMCFLRPFLQHCLQRLNILKRIGLGLMLLTVSLVPVCVASAVIIIKANKDINGTTATCLQWYNISKPHLHMYIDTKSLVSFLCISQLINGAGYLMVFVSVLEFILAQSPRSMQGLLVGLWYAYQSLGLAIHLLLTLFANCTYWPLIVKTLGTAVSVIVYTIISHRFKYRRREEPSDINYRTIIEAYTEKQLMNTHVTY